MDRLWMFRKDYFKYYGSGNHPFELRKYFRRVSLRRQRGDTATICRQKAKPECKEIKWILSGEGRGEMTAARLDFNSIEIKSFGSKSSAAGTHLQLLNSISVRVRRAPSSSSSAPSASSTSSTSAVQWQLDLLLMTAANCRKIGEIAKRRRRALGFPRPTQIYCDSASGSAHRPQKYHLII